MSQEKKVEYNTNTVEYSDASVHGVSSAMYKPIQDLDFWATST